MSCVHFFQRSRFRLRYSRTAKSLEVVDCPSGQAGVPTDRSLAGAAGAAQYRRSVWESAHNAVMQGKQVPCPIMRLCVSESLGLLGLCESSTRAVLCFLQCYTWWMRSNNATAVLRTFVQRSVACTTCIGRLRSPDVICEHCTVVALSVALEPFSTRLTAALERPDEQQYCAYNQKYPRPPETRARTMITKERTPPYTPIRCTTFFCAPNRTTSRFSMTYRHFSSACCEYPCWLTNSRLRLA